MRVTPRRCSVTGPEGPPSPFSRHTEEDKAPRAVSVLGRLAAWRRSSHSSPPPRLPALGSATPRCCHGPPSRPLIRAADHLRPGSEFLNLATSRSMLPSWDCKTIFFFHEILSGTQNRYKSMDECFQAIQIVTVYRTLTPFRESKLSSRGRKLL